MTAIDLFHYQDQQVRTLTIDGEPWFVAADVCEILGIANHRDALTRLEAHERGVGTTDTLGGPQQVSIISESGLYALTFTSRKAEARAFRIWVTTDVLPTIRRTGTYSTTPALPQTYAEALRELASTVEAKELAEARAEALEPAAQAWGVMVSATGDYAVDEAAKILSRDPAITIGRKRLFTLMGEIGWIYRHGSRNRWHAYQSHVDNGRLVQRMSAAFLNSRTGEMEAPAPTIRVTPKGLEALHRILHGESTLVPLHEVTA